MLRLQAENDALAAQLHEGEVLRVPDHIREPVIDISEHSPYPTPAQLSRARADVTRILVWAHGNARLENQAEISRGLRESGVSVEDIEQVVHWHRVDDVLEPSSALMLTLRVAALARPQGKVRPLVDYIQHWLRDRPATSVEISIGDRGLKLTDPQSDDIDDLVSNFVARSFERERTGRRE